MWIAVARSCSVPESIARSAVSDSLTPPAQDWMSVARCDCEGRCESPTRIAPASTRTPPTYSHQGAFWTGQPPCRSGTCGGSVLVGVVIGAASLCPLADEGGARGQLRLGNRPVDPLHDAVTRVQEVGGGQARQAVGDEGGIRCGRGGDGVGDAALADERQRGRGLVVDVDADDRHARVPGAVELREQGRLPLAGRAPGGEEVHDDGPAGQRAEGYPLPGMTERAEAEVLRRRGRGVLRAAAAGAGEAQGHDHGDPGQDGREGGQPGRAEASQPVHQAPGGAAGCCLGRAHRRVLAVPPAAVTASCLAIAPPAPPARGPAGWAGATRSLAQYRRWRPPGRKAPLPPGWPPGPGWRPPGRKVPLPPGWPPGPGWRPPGRKARLPPGWPPGP